MTLGSLGPAGVRCRNGIYAEISGVGAEGYVYWRS